MNLIEVFTLQWGSESWGRGDLGVGVGGWFAFGLGMGLHCLGRSGGLKTLRLKSSGGSGWDGCGLRGI